MKKSFYKQHTSLLCLFPGRSQSRTTHNEWTTQRRWLLPRSCTNRGPVRDVLAGRTLRMDYALFVKGIFLQIIGFIMIDPKCSTCILEANIFSYKIAPKWRTLGFKNSLKMCHLKRTNLTIKFSWLLMMSYNVTLGVPEKADPNECCVPLYISALIEGLHTADIEIFVLH